MTKAQAYRMLIDARDELAMQYWAVGSKNKAAMEQAMTILEQAINQIGGR